MTTLKRTLMALLTLGIIAICFAMPKTAKAAGEKTYTFHWDGSKWCYQTSLDTNWVGVENFAGSFKAGDSIIVDGQSQAGLATCELSVSGGTGDVCAAGGAKVIVNVSGGTVGKAYAVIGGTLIVNGDVNLATPVGTGVLQVNGNVNTLEVNYDSGNAKYGVSGTVGKAYAKINSETPDTYYSIKAGKMNPDDKGIVWLKDGEYSKTAGSAPANTSAPATAKTSGNDGYDKVPKTGYYGLGSSLLLIVIALMTGTTSIVLLKKKED